MSVINRLVVTTNTNGVTPVGFSNADAPKIIRECADLLGRAAQGGCSANVKLAFAPVAAQGKLTMTGNGTNGDTITIGNVVITIVTSGATGNQVNVAASPTALATAVAAVVNTSSSFTGVATASSAAAVLTLTAALPGTIGNGLQLSESSTSITLTNAFGSLTAGSEGSARSFSLGL